VSYQTFAVVEEQMLGIVGGGVLEITDSMINV
jgi:hypothetical protein